MDKKLLIHIIKENIPANEEQIDQMLSYFRPLVIKKDEFLLMSGQICKELAFVQSGILRMFYVNQEGNEITCHFASAGEFIASNKSFNLGTPSYENIQAVVDAELWLITRPEVEKVSQEQPAIQRLWKKEADQMTFAMENKIALLQTHTAEERYHALFTSHPALFLQVPLQYLASYLGITPQHMSRLRKKP